MVPSLRGIEALTALSSRGGLTAAAEKLGVTRSALSHRIADLEKELGVALVEKEGRHARLTDDAKALLNTIGDAFDRIYAAVEPLKRARTQLRVSTVSTFASCWLLPRLSHFRAVNPTIDIALSTTLRTIDLESEDCDCAIRHGLGDWPGLTSTLLFRETLAPVAAPEANHDLMHGPIIRARSRYRDWVRWWNVSCDAVMPERTAVTVETRALALDAALAGAGIAMMDMAYARPLIAEGRLVQLAPVVELGEGYFLTYPAKRRNARFLTAFRDWIVSAAASESSNHKWTAA